LAAFATPTIVHFCAVLYTAAVLSAPWRGLAAAALAIAAAGILGVGYALLVWKRTRRQTEYAPVVEDWIFHVLLPLLAYGALLVGGLLLLRHPDPCLFAVGGSTLVLLFVGIHNAWDAVTYIARRRQAEPPA
jgi:hypothetical protein